MNKKQKGFILLITIIILSAIALLAVLEMSALVFDDYQTTFDQINKQKSIALALSCRNVALLRLAKDPSYVATAENVTVASSSCEILSVQSSSSSLTSILETTASSSAIISNILTRVTIDKNGLTIDSSEEVEKF